LEVTSLETAVTASEVQAQWQRGKPRILQVNSMVSVSRQRNVENNFKLKQLKERLFELGSNAEMCRSGRQKILEEHHSLVP